MYIEPRIQVEVLWVFWLLVFDVRFVISNAECRTWTATAVQASSLGMATPLLLLVSSGIKSVQCQHNQCGRNNAWQGRNQQQQLAARQHQLAPDPAPAPASVQRLAEARIGHRRN